MHRLHGVERDGEVAGVLNVDHQLRPTARRDLANGAELFATIRYERLESYFNLLLHDVLLAVINLRPGSDCRTTPWELHTRRASRRELPPGGEPGSDTGLS